MLHVTVEGRSFRGEPDNSDLGQWLINYLKYGDRKGLEHEGEEFIKIRGGRFQWDGESDCSTRLYPTLITQNTHLVHYHD